MKLLGRHSVVWDRFFPSFLVAITKTLCVNEKNHLLIEFINAKML